jgi:hypothetical protein
MHAQTPPVVVPGLEGLSGHLVSRHRFCRRLNADSVAQAAHSTRPRLAQGMRGTHSTRSWEKSHTRPYRMACHEQA